MTCIKKRLDLPLYLQGACSRLATYTKVAKYSPYNLHKLSGITKWFIELTQYKCQAKPLNESIGRIKLNFFFLTSNPIQTESMGFFCSLDIPGRPPEKSSLTTAWGENKGSRCYFWNRQEIARASGSLETVGIKQALIKSTDYIPYDRMHLVSAPSVAGESREKRISVETQKPHGKFFSQHTFFFATGVQFFSWELHYLSLSSENTIGGHPIYSRDFGDIQPHIWRQIKEGSV